MRIKILFVLLHLSSCAIQTTSSRCEEFCANRGEECVGVRATGTRARSMVLGRAADFDRTKNPYRCQKKAPVEVD